MSPDRAVFFVFAIFVFLALPACGPESSVSSSAGGTGAGGTGGAYATGGSPGTGGSPATGGAGSGGEAGDAGAVAGGNDIPLSGDLFADTNVPVCEPGFSTVKIRGTLNGVPIDLVMEASSNMSSYLSIGFYDIYMDSMLLQWDGYFTEGVATPLTGGSMVFSSEHPAEGEYCIIGGDIGPEPDPRRYGPDTSLLRFRISTITVGADCSAPPIATNLRACMFRNNGFVPGVP